MDIEMKEHQAEGGAGDRGEAYQVQEDAKGSGEFSAPPNNGNGQVDTEQVLHTARDGEVGDDGPGSPTGKKQESIISRYKTPIGIISAFLIIAIIGACVAALLITQDNGVASLDLEGDKEAAYLNGQDGITLGELSELLGQTEDDAEMTPTIKKKVKYYNKPRVSQYQGGFDPSASTELDAYDCPLSRFGGYIQTMETCDVCPANQVYDQATQACVAVACRDDQISQGDECIQCPNWQRVNEMGTCEDKCATGGLWDSAQGLCSANYENTCKRTTDWVFREKRGNYDFFDDKCERQCSTVQIYLDTARHYFFPKGLQCCDSDECTVQHGQWLDNFHTEVIGADDACIYLIEMQGYAPDSINAVKYYYTVENDTTQSLQYNTHIFGNYDPAVAAQAHSFDGCLRGFFGWYNADGAVSELGFNYKYSTPHRCAISDDGGLDNCACVGDVYMGLYKKAGTDEMLTFEQMKQINPDYRVVKGVTDSIICGADEFGGDPFPNQMKQCYCDTNPSN